MPGAYALPVLGAMFRTLAEGAAVPVVAHLDHGEDLATCRAAIDCGFTSVMYDGSGAALCRECRPHRRDRGDGAGARRVGRGGTGFVGYHGGRQSVGTDPAEVARFAEETGVDALAVSVGNSHLMTVPGAEIDMARLMAIMGRRRTCHWSFTADRSAGGRAARDCARHDGRQVQHRDRIAHGLWICASAGGNGQSGAVRQGADPARNHRAGDRRRAKGHRQPAWTGRGARSGFIGILTGQAG